MNFRKMNATTVYLILAFGGSLLYSMIFTVNMIYQITVAEFNPLQLVLLGTILEVTVFLFEIPTGVVADVKSRRLSVIIGYALVGCGFLIEGLVPLFWPIALAQVLWGLGFTFTSGATQAWIADEVGEDKSSDIFLQGSQVRRIGGLLGIPASMILGSIAINLPIWVGGLGLVLLSAFLLLFMPEVGFSPTPKAERETWASMKRTVVEAHQLILRQRVMLILLSLGLFYGLYSEGFDRLWTDHLLKNFTLPAIGVLEPVIYFGIIRAVALVLSMVVTEVVRRKLDTRKTTPLAYSLMVSAMGIIISLIGFGLTRSIWVALALYWVIGVLRGVTEPLLEVWLNQRIDNPKVRATMFSVSGQVDAIGQIAGGPVVGVIGNMFSVRAALITSAFLLSPVVPLYRLAVQRGREDGQQMNQLLDMK